MELADDACGGLRCLPGMKKRVVGALEAGLGLERRVDRLDDAFRARKASLENPRDAGPLVRELAAGEVDAGDLEERDLLGAGIEIPPDGLDEMGQEARAEARQLDGDRLLQLPGRVLGHHRGRVDLREAEPDEGLLEAPAQLLLPCQAAEHLAASGQRERDVLEAEAGDLL